MAITFVDFACNVMQLNKADYDSDLALAKAGIDALAKFFKEIGVPSSLSALKVGSEHFADMAKHIDKYWLAPLSAFIVPFTEQDVVAVLKAAW